MTEAAPAVGASDIINPAPAVTQVDIDMANVRMEFLKTDTAFQDRVKKGDPAAFAERTKLWRVAHGLPPEAAPPVNTADVLAQEDTRALAENESRVNLMRGDGLDDQQIYEILNQRPMPYEERQMHERELARLKRDKAWVQRYLTAIAKRVGKCDCSRPQRPCPSAV